VRKLAADTSPENEAVVPCRFADNESAPENEVVPVKDELPVTLKFFPISKLPQP